MLIEVKGTDTVNKGAELMLHAILQQVRRQFPGAQMVMPPKHQDYPKRARLELWQKLWLQRYGVQWGNLGKAVPRKLRRRYGLILNEEIDVVLDASGFRYSDQFGDAPSLEMARDVKTWKKRGTRVILLPQAFGPFTTGPIRDAFTSIVDHADLVFPRDDMSYKYVTELVGERANVIQSPDFTNLIQGVRPDQTEPFAGRYCLVPNGRMLDKTSPEDSALYTSFCARSIRCLLELGQTPFILIHEGVTDVNLAERIVSEVGEEIPIIRETDPLRIKGILGLCSGVISSRFHALVSCLSQGVPVLATGWSHKYEMLLGEYGVPEACLSVSMTDPELQARIAALVGDDSRQSMIANITQASSKYKAQAEHMWEEVFSVMQSKSFDGESLAS